MIHYITHKCPNVPYFVSFDTKKRKISNDKNIRDRNKYLNLKLAFYKISCIWQKRTMEESRELADFMCKCFKVLLKFENTEVFSCTKL